MQLDVSHRDDGCRNRPEEIPLLLIHGILSFDQIAKYGRQRHQRRGGGADGYEVAVVVLVHEPERHGERVGLQGIDQHLEREETHVELLGFAVENRYGVPPAAVRLVQLLILFWRHGAVQEQQPQRWKQVLEM